MATQVTPRDPELNTLPQEHEGGQMTFFDHLDELRRRVTRAALSIALGMIAALFFTTPVIEAMKASYGDRLLITGPTDSVVIFFKVALMLGAILASPIITYHLFMFVIPGLTRTEKRWVLAALPGTTGLFLFGLAFTWTLLIPAYVGFLSDFQSGIFKVQWTADSYIGFVSAVLFWHAAAFETPLIFFVLGRLGLTTAGAMVRWWRQAVIGSAIVAAFITPTIDPVTMLVIAGILLTLYTFSIALVFIAARIWKPLITSVDA